MTTSFGDTRFLAIATRDFARGSLEVHGVVPFTFEACAVARYRTLKPDKARRESVAWAGKLGER